MTRNRTIGVAAVCVTILMAAFVAKNQAAVHDAGAASEPPSVKGDLKVSSELVLSDKDGSSATEQCSAIEFHQEFVVLKLKAGGGRVIPVRQIKTLRWEGK